MRCWWRPASPPGRFPVRCMPSNTLRSACSRCSPFAIDGTSAACRPPSSSNWEPRRSRSTTATPGAPVSQNSRLGPPIAISRPPGRLSTPALARPDAPLASSRPNAGTGTTPSTSKGPSCWPKGCFNGSGSSERDGQGTSILPTHGDPAGDDYPPCHPQRGHPNIDGILRRADHRTAGVRQRDGHR